MSNWRGRVIIADIVGVEAAIAFASLVFQITKSDS
ncbi:MAG: hypothetical protein ACI9ON_001848 [Limisphaerales bacterium]|jgi:hypothetical protein